MSKIALVVRQDFSMERLDVAEDFLAKMQNAVDGLIQPVDLTSNLTLWVNEEGLLRNDLGVNRFASIMYQEFFKTPDLLLGNAVFTGGTDPEGETLGLSDGMIASLVSWVTSLETVAREQD
tara:strand:- start:4685 stop:5047 length:363 start_codon:yes stop_codon:yes gene_type:complete